MHVWESWRHSILLLKYTQCVWDKRRPDDVTRFWVYISAADLLRDLSHIFSVLPAGKHVGEGEWLQTGVDQIWLQWLLLVLLCSRKPTQQFWPCTLNIDGTTALLTKQVQHGISVARGLSNETRTRSKVGLIWTDLIICKNNQVPLHSSERHSYRVKPTVALNTLTGFSGFEMHF